MKKRFARAALCSTILTLSLGAATAWAAGKLHGTAETKAGVSGHSGTEHVLSAGSNFFLYGMEWSERNDEPCYLKAYFFGHDGKKWTSKTKELSLCKRSSSMKSVSLVAPTSGETARAVRQIEVCTSKKKASRDERLKGIRIKAREIDLSNMALRDDNANEEDKRNHCKRWHDEAACKNGQLATELIVVEGTRGKGDESIVGLGLRCAKPAR